MITILRPGSEGIERVEGLEEGCWIHLVAPSEDELKRIEAALGILPEFLRYPLDEEETSRVEREADQLLIIVKIPDPRHEEVLLRYETIPVGIILTETSIITVCLKEVPLFDELVNGRARGAVCDPVRFVFNLFLRIASLYLRHLRLIDRLINEYEEELHRSLRNQELIRLLNLEKSLVYFNTSLKANDLVMARLQSGRYLPISEENEDLLEDALIENQQAIEMAKIYSDILSGMMDAYASVISNNLNIVMKFLTAVTIVLSLPTLVASVYGMNIPLPFQHSPHAFAIIMGISFVLSAGVVIIFVKKKML